MEKKKVKDTTTSEGTLLITAPVVSKKIITPEGQVTDETELYIRRSIQDYYIKFCESDVTRDELETHLDGLEGEIKAVTMEVVQLDGDWDICDGVQLQPTRVGPYMIIRRIAAP
ncbi:MAG: hypothetical protein AAF466_05400 [Bacteroidota bacterium]